MNYIKRACAVMASVLVSALALAQTGSVSGTVTDEYGEPVIGAVVYYEGTSISAITDVDGKYVIKTMPDETLVYSCFGLQEQKVKVQSQKVINMTLKAETMSLEDAVVIGYGSTSRKDLTGSISSVKADDIRKAGASNLVGSLQGRVAGLNITSQSGEPGAGYQIKIRGNNSINADSSPLFVIDGMQMDSSSGGVASSDATGTSSFDPLSFLNPSDIESIEVLKDASATAIYGSQGANGVVIITTKSGSASLNKTSVVFDASVGIATVPKKIEMMSPQDYIDYRFARKDYGYDGYGADLDEDGILDGPKDASAYPQYDWQDLLYRDAISQNYSLSMSSVIGKNTQISAGVGYLNQQGLVVSNDYQRYTARLKIDHPINDKVKVGASVNYGRNISRGAVASGGGSLGYNGLIQLIYLERPVALITPDDTDYTNGFVSLYDMVVNETYKKTVYQRTSGNLYVNWDIIDGLTFRASAAGSTSDSTMMEYYTADSRWGSTKNGYGTHKTVGTFNWNASATLSYKKSWNDAHNFDVMVGGEISQNHDEHFSVSAENFADESTGAFDISKGGIIKTPDQLVSESARMSFFARTGYNYKSRYYLNLNFRADGSSKFYAGNRVGYFPSASLAWRINEEPWMENTKGWLDNFKLRLSAGASGNDRISTYAALAVLDINYYASNGNEIMGQAPSAAANPKLKWETTYQYNVGVDFNVFQYRLNFTADLYYKDTRDMLYLATLSGQTGYTSQWQNLGRVENKGIEISISSHNIDKKNFKWSTNLTFDLSRNKVLDIGGVDYTSVNISQGTLSNDISRIMVGQPIGVGYGYVWDGNYQIEDFVVSHPFFGELLPSDYNQINDANFNQFTFKLREDVPNYFDYDTKPGDRKYKDISGPEGKPDGVVNTYDRTVISDSNPDFTMGLGNTFSIYDFDLTIFLEGVYGRDIMNEFKLRSESGLSGSTQFNCLTKDAWENHWTVANRSNTYSRLLNTSNTACSSYYVEDGSYLRIKTLSLAYNLPDKYCKKIKFQGLRFSFNVDNAFVFTKYSGMDPDVSYPNKLFPGFDRMSYPKARTFTFGLTATF